MKLKEIAYTLLWLVTLAMLVLKIWFPAVWPEQLDLLPYLLILALSTINLIRSLKSPPEETPDGTSWRLFWLLWLLIGVVLIALSFLWNMDLLLLLGIWLAIALLVQLVAIIITAIASRADD